MRHFFLFNTLHTQTKNLISQPAPFHYDGKLVVVVLRRGLRTIRNQPFSYVQLASVHRSVARSRLF